MHAHVPVPPVANNFLLTMLATNTAMATPLSGGAWHVPMENPVSEEAFRESVAAHVTYTHERGIGVQIVRPRPNVALGWVQSHLIPAWTGTSMT